MFRCDIECLLKSNSIVNSAIVRWKAWLNDSFVFHHFLDALTIDYTEKILYSTGYSRFLQNSSERANYLAISNIQGALYTDPWLI